MVAAALVVGRRQVQDQVGEAAQTLEALAVVEIAKHRSDAERAPFRRPLGTANKHQQPIVATQEGKRTAGDVAAADDK